MEFNDIEDLSNPNKMFPWMRHMVHHSVPPEDFPVASAPIIYEGFVPEQDQPPSHYPPPDQELTDRSQFHALNDVDRSIPLPTENSPGAGRGRGRGRGQGRGRGRGRGMPKTKGGWSKGIKIGPRAVIDPGEEFNALHKEATEAFIDQQDDEKALAIILKAISINPEIYSAHVLLSEIYFARNDDERGIAALFSGAHASPNDPNVWHQLADVCLQRSSDEFSDRVTLLRQASYCFQRLLQIDKEDHEARFQKAAISRELGYATKALKDLDYLLQKMPHNSSVLRQIAEVCLDINDVGRAIGLYDDALEYYRLEGSKDDESFNWEDLIVYVDLIARPNGPLKALEILKNIARWLLGRADETYWDSFVEDDREWDPEHYPRRAEVPDFWAERYPIDAYGIGLPLEIRVKMGEFRLKCGYRQEAFSHLEWLLPDDREEGAPLYDYTDLFLQVADALRESKEYEQALRYYEALYSVEACDDVDFWLGLGACSYVCEKREQALHCYEEAKAADPTSGEARTQLSKLYAGKGEREKALVLAREAITLFESQLPQTERRKYERKDLRESREAAQKAYKEAYGLPKPHSEKDLPAPSFSRRARERARRLAKEAAAASVATATATATATAVQEEAEEPQELRESSLEPPERRGDVRERERERETVTKKTRKKTSRKERTVQQRHDNMQQLYSTLEGVTEAMREGEEVSRNIWMDCAEALVEEFRQQKAFYPPERYMKFVGYDQPYQRRTQELPVEGLQELQDIPLPSVESTVPTEYCGIEFSTWLDIFLEYAMLLANTQEETTDCYTVINAATDCNVWYHDISAMIQIYTCWLACAIALRDEVGLFTNILRWFMREFGFCTDTYRLFAALNLYYPLHNDKGGKAGQMNNAVFRAGPNQKFLFRQIMALDAQLPEDYGADHPSGPVPEFIRKPTHDVQYLPDRVRRARQSRPVARPLTPSHSQSAGPDGDGYEDDENDEDERDEDAAGLPSHRAYSPKDLDVVLLILYGQILYAGQSFPNALSYFYRAYSVDPKNSIVLLSISLCYIHQMMKRQNENRHVYLLQGWSFFDKYAEVRIEWAVNKEREDLDWKGTLMGAVKREIEFNRARCWHMLGMSDMAIRSYGRMLDMQIVKQEGEMDIDADADENRETFSKEAAYAMMTMYALNGDIDSAREITERHLVVE